jgi:hypothetical protein
MVALSLAAVTQHHLEDDMRYRREDDDGDYTFGQGDDTWLVNSPEAVAQAIKTRFLLWYGNGSWIPQKEHPGFSPFWVSKSQIPTTSLSESGSSKRRG